MHSHAPLEFSDGLPTRRRHIRTPEHDLLGSQTVKRHHHWSPLWPIYHLEVDESPLERPRASTRRSHLRNPWPTRQSLSQLLKPRLELSELRFKKAAPPFDSKTSDLSSATKIALIGASTCHHAPMRLRHYLHALPCASTCLRVRNIRQ